MKKQQGFSLIELLIVVGIIAALSAIAVPAYVNKQKIAEFNSGLASGRALLTRLDLYLDENSGSTASKFGEKLGDATNLGELATVTVSGASEEGGEGENAKGTELKVTFNGNSSIDGTIITFEKNDFAWVCKYTTKETFEDGEIKGCKKA
ncbi:pilin [Salinivibrio kushneri]|uniref:Prepilin-type N-terminal cleavage/methylation domain-containing protein n=1 Tax=Salinivibrio kushneri TaxID=1908198 RepID=A0AA47KLB9_9GAMM|nr:prepilin-type N-terminal cleavage/methylation domain-containing protein [Salinivibrio kushneri]WBA09031.1 prepilin-type N-terminal cleavage/methylation domain-containing protein [Salinivibrio kushneri]